jgi:hypothetical protein
MSNTRARLPPKTATVDWWRVIVDLNRAGWSDERIGKECGCDRSTVTRLRNDFEYSIAREPLYRLGVAILALWMAELGRGAADIPCGLSRRSGSSMGA